MVGRREARHSERQPAVPFFQHSAVQGCLLAHEAALVGGLVLSGSAPRMIGSLRVPRFVKAAAGNVVERRRSIAPEAI